MSSTTQNSEPSDDLQRKPWNPFFEAHSKFLNALDCIHEMFRLVAPVLEAKDKERQQRITELGEEIKDGKGRVGRRLKSIEEVHAFLGYIRRMRAADLMFRQSIITSVVAKFDEFLTTLLLECYKHNTCWLKNLDKTVSYKEVLEIDSLDAFKADLTRREVDRLMRDSHHAQIAFIDGKLKIGLQEEFGGWKRFLEITERRNLFVHNGGWVNDTYFGNAKKFGFDVSPKVNRDSIFSAGDQYVANAIDCFYELSVRVVQGAVRRLFPDCFDEADGILNNSSVDLLSEERWDLAEGIFRYAMGIPEKLRSRGEWYYYFLINRSIALKFAGKDFRGVLGSVDWTPFHPKYEFAVSVLEERFDDAGRLMRSEAVKESVNRDNFLKWPLLRDFRKTEQFQQAFKEIFGDGVEDEILAETRSQIVAQQSDTHGVAEERESDCEANPT